MVKQWYYRNVLYVVVENEDIWKNQKAKVILSSVGLETSLSKVSLLGDILF